MCAYTVRCGDIATLNVTTLRGEDVADTVGMNVLGSDKTVLPSRKDPAGLVLIVTHYIWCYALK